MEAEGEYSSLRADPWIRAFFNREFGAAVTLGGSFHAAGPLRTPAKIDLQSHARDVAVDFPSVQWRNAQPVDVHYSDGRLALSRFVMRGPSTELAIEGAVRFHRWRHAGPQCRGHGERHLADRVRSQPPGHRPLGPALAPDRHAGPPPAERRHRYSRYELGLQRPALSL